MPTRPYTRRLGLLFAAVLASCGGGGDGDPGLGGLRTPASILPVSLARQAGQAGQLVSSTPTVTVLNADGLAIEGVAVEFEVSSGGGTVTPASAETGANGQAQAAWQLGATGAQELRARLPGTGLAATFTADILPAGGGYHIDLRLLSTATDAQWTAFTSAAARIEQVVVGSLPALNVTGGTCDGTRLSGTVGGLEIRVRLVPIDGEKGTLGRAGPCVVRTSSFLPAVGVMEFDTADLAMLEADGRLGSTILHEMLHVVGFGFWEAPFPSRLVGAGTADSAFTGTRALAAAIGYNGAPSSWSSVPVENCVGFAPGKCGAGTQDSHWREKVFKDELMTGYISGPAQPLSRTTIASLADLGYTVNLEAGDQFDLGLAALLAPGSSSEALPLGDDLLRIPIDTLP